MNSKDFEYIGALSVEDGAYPFVLPVFAGIKGQFFKQRINSMGKIADFSQVSAHTSMLIKTSHEGIKRRLGDPAVYLTKLAGTIYFAGSFFEYRESIKRLLGVHEASVDCLQLEIVISRRSLSEYPLKK